MAEIIEVLRDHVPAYPIVLSGSFEELPGALKPLGLEKRKVCIVTDSRVAGLCLRRVQELFEKEAEKTAVFVFPEGERQKNLDTVRDLYEFLIKEGFMKRTPRGREVTELAYKHLGRAFFGRGTSLFDS